MFSQQQVCIVYYLRVLLGTEGGRGSRNLKAFTIRGEDEVQRSPGNVVRTTTKKKKLLKRQDNLIEKWAKDLNRRFPQ